ncbi:hypothetical protein, partial [Pseudomonas proteolytica]|uniref:hypothetical protein n=1 Tax=Pseudomonas proteolytica TaxID=219574 RepID=UPI001CA45EC8
MFVKIKGESWFAGSYRGFQTGRKLRRGGPFDIALAHSKLDLLWRAGLPRAGLRSSPKPGNRGLSGETWRAYWGCFAAQRG